MSLAESSLGASGAIEFELRTLFLRDIGAQHSEREVRSEDTLPVVLEASWCPSRLAQVAKATLHCALWALPNATRRLFIGKGKNLGIDGARFPREHVNVALELVVEPFAERSDECLGAGIRHDSRNWHGCDGTARDHKARPLLSGELFRRKGFRHVRNVENVDTVGGLEVLVSQLVNASSDSDSSIEAQHADVEVFQFSLDQLVVLFDCGELREVSNDAPGVKLGVLRLDFGQLILNLALVS